jgi:hypothetical protein
VTPQQLQQQQQGPYAYNFPPLGGHEDLTAQEERLYHGVTTFAAANPHLTALREFPHTPQGLTYGQMSCLSAGSFLTDTLVDVYLQLLQWQSRKVLLLPTSVWSEFKTRSKKHLEAYAEVKRAVQNRMELFKVHDTSAPP